MASYAVRLDALDASLAMLVQGVERAVAQPGDSAARAQAQRAFREARTRFKQVEMLTEYFAPWLAREINGPVLDRADEDDPDTIIPPTGFQAIEATVFEDGVPLPARTARLALALRGNVATLRRIGADTLAGEGELFDAAKQEIARVATLGIAGFDATVSGDAMIEGAAALSGVRESLAPYWLRLRTVDRARAAALDSSFDASMAYLREHRDFDTFDRLTFISTYIQPLAHDLAAAQRRLGIAPSVKPRAWSGDHASIFDAEAVDPRFFAPRDAPLPTPALVALGEALFVDPILSPSGTRSCASCHLPDHAFTDARSRPRLLSTHAGDGARNTPTLIGASLQPVLFADERASFLEDQITDVLGSSAEMGGSLETATTALRAHPELRARFATAFATTGDSAVTASRVRFAIAAYLRSIRTGASRFDRAVAGDTAALTAGERRGFNLFMGRAACGTCHFAPLFNGVTPPSLIEAEPEVIGVPSRWPSARSSLDADEGQAKVRRTRTNSRAFKTPTLRNIALTAPYMHNGAMRTLGDVIDFYDAGGGLGVGLDVPNQTLSADSLHLSVTEKADLIAFLRSLTDTTLLRRSASGATH